MSDDSHLDQKYFISEYVYNCPFCNRRHVSYVVTVRLRFDWTLERPCWVYAVRCGSCEGISMHLTFEELDLASYGGGNYRFRFDEDADAGTILDEVFFYSVPTSFFVLDKRVPAVLRELLTEAEGCLKSNFLTGASACARKIVYELAVLKNATGDHYEARIRSLKSLHPEVEPAFFDTLLTIQQLTSSKVHENAYDGWESRHLRIVLAALREVLHELYVVPNLRNDRRKSVLALKEELLSDSDNRSREV